MSSEVRSLCVTRGIPEDGAAGEMHPLVVFQYGDDHSGQPANALEADLHLPFLAGSHSAETWSTPELGRMEEDFGFKLVSTNALTVGSITLRGGDVRENTRLAYSWLFELLGERGLHLLRAWNTIPNITAGATRLDQYMSFVEVRSEVLERRFGPGFKDHLCAMTAVGSKGDTQVLVFVASPEPGVSLENPRQISAYRYPRRYGPRSPAFARATKTSEAAGSRLLISGTASIVGHETQHVGDVEAQTHEIVKNIRALLGGRALAAMRVYLKQRDHLDAVRSILLDVYGAQVHALYAHADLCREDLLVEIEGVSGPMSQDLRR